MEYKCEVIRDLLPLYHDGVCSRESATAVEEHLAQCVPCQDAYQALLGADQVVPEPEGKAESSALGKSLKKLKHSVKWKTAAICLVVVLILATAATGAGMWLNSATIPLPEDLIESSWKEQWFDRETGNKEQAVIVNMKEEYVEAYNLRRYGICTCQVQVEIDGKKEWVMLCTVLITRWEHFLDKTGLRGHLADLPDDDFLKPHYIIKVDRELEADTRRTEDEAGELTEEDFSAPDLNITRLYFFPEREYMKDFGKQSPEAQRDILQNHAVQVWRNDGESRVVESPSSKRT